MKLALVISIALALVATALPVLSEVRLFSGANYFHHTAWNDTNNLTSSLSCFFRFNPQEPAAAVGPKFARYETVKKEAGLADSADSADSEDSSDASESVAVSD